MQSSEIRVGDKVYRYKRPVLGLLKKYKHLEKFIVEPESFGKMVENDEAYSRFIGDWPQFVHDIFENADGEIMIDKLVPLDALAIIAGFFVCGANAMTAKLTSPGLEIPKESGSPQNIESTSSSTPSQTRTSEKGDG